MNAAHWHLMLNHMPILGSLFGTVILAFGLLLQRTDMKRLGLAFFIFSAAMVLPVQFTGEQAEKVLQPLGLENDGFIHRHEEKAEILLWTCMVIGLVSMFAFYLEVAQKGPRRQVMILVLALSIANGYLVKVTATTGGEIRHTELREPGFQPAVEAGDEDESEGH